MRDHCSFLKTTRESCLSSSTQERKKKRLSVCVCKRKSLLISRNHTSAFFHSLPCSFLIRPHLLFISQTLLQESLGTVPNPAVSCFFTHFSLIHTHRHDRKRHWSSSAAICRAFFLLPARFTFSSHLFSLVCTVLPSLIWPCLCLGERFNGGKWGLIKRRHIRGNWSVLN